MSAINPPIKRSAELAPLSREHHHGLLAVWKIRQGIKKEVHPERIVAFVQWFWRTELEAHFKKEELVLLPYLSHAPELNQRLLDEHSAIADHVGIVQHNSYWETLENLAHDLNQHIRWEERMLFNELEQRLKPDEKEQVGRQLNVESVRAEWEDVFWER